GQSDMVWGHVALRDRHGRGVWMKAHLRGFEEVSNEDVLLIDWDGEVLQGTGRRHGEFPIHTEIMASRPDINCTIHTHSMNACAFASTGQQLRPISHDACLFVPPDIARFTKTGDLITTKELGTELASALGDRNAILMPQHGMVATGPSVGHAVMTAVLLDRACATQLRAREVVRWSSDEEALSKRDHCWNPRLLDIGWDYLVRSTLRAGSDPFL
ncbi:MAG: class II aldolase/adducin family protein, partial [Nitrososphaerales archaeon]